MLRSNEATHHRPPDPSPVSETRRRTPAWPVWTLEFALGSAALAGGHRAIISAIARRVLVEQVGGVRVTGIERESGGEFGGTTLGLHRAQAIAAALRQELQRREPGSERRVHFELVSRSARTDEQGDHAGVTVRFRAAAAVEARTFRVTARSFTNRCDAGAPRIGSPVPPAGESGEQLLVSRADLVVTYRGAELLSLELVGEVSIGGSLEEQAAESPAESTSSSDTPLLMTRVDGTRARFSWGVRRWQVLRGIVDCSSGTPMITLLTVEGSAMMSHRTWVDDTPRRDGSP